MKELKVMRFWLKHLLFVWGVFLLLCCFWLHCMAWRILVPHLGINLRPLQQKLRVLTTGLSEKCPSWFFYEQERPRLGRTDADFPRGKDSDGICPTPHLSMMSRFRGGLKRLPGLPHLRHAAASLPGGEGR